MSAINSARRTDTPEIIDQVALLFNGRQALDNFCAFIAQDSLRQQVDPDLAPTFRREHPVNFLCYVSSVTASAKPLRGIKLERFQKLSNVCPLVGAH
jgi:hypothetical protein